MTERSDSERSPAQGLARRLVAAPLHPVLFFLFPVVSLLAWNIQELYPEQAIRSLVAAPAACLALWALLALITRDGLRAAVLTSLAGLLFFSYGHVYALLSGVRSLGFPLARHRFLLPLWVGLFLAAWAIMTHKRSSGRSITPLLNLIGGAALLLPVLSLSTLYLRAHTSNEGESGRIPTVVLRPRADEPFPDIYYIILDGYARSDYMSEAIGLDNSEFIAFLESEGFYVAAESRSNHNWTSLSLASSLNLTFAQDLGANMIPGYYPTPFIDFIRHSLVSRSLKEIGYHTIGLQSGYVPTEWIDAEAFLGPATGSVPSLNEGLRPNAFESMLLETTVLEPLLSTRIIRLDYVNNPSRPESYSRELLRTIILSELDNLAQPLPLDAPRLVFAHIVAPHHPYLFTASGEPLASDEPFTLMETGESSGDTRSLYRDQAAYLTDRIQQVIRSILSSSSTPPVIILQADHGAGLGLGEDERTSILNALLIREDCRSMLYPSITPVNTFRVVFNCYFDSQLPLVEDRVYWSKWPRRSAYEFSLIYPEQDQPDDQNTPVTK